MSRAPTLCSQCNRQATCGNRCDQHPSKQRRQQDQRPSAATRGYNHRHVSRFRKAVLARDPTCIICRHAPSTDADHWPRTRRQLVAEGADPNDPDFGRGLCHPCHSRHTGFSRGVGPFQDQHPHETASF